MEAYLYTKENDLKAQCNLCSHSCLIKPSKRGICKVRANHDGQLESLVYGKLIAHNVDPIEKKPLFHILPGSLSYSIATVGCNFKCRFCQNADIAQMPSDYQGRIWGEYVSPEDIVADAINGDCKSIAYTYTEPTIYFELAFDTAKIAHTNNLINIFVTNGYLTAQAIEMIHPYLDAANVDLKSFSDDFYRQQCKARLQPVLESLRLMKAKGIFVEVTTLLIPGLNDHPDELKALAEFIVNDLGTETPWHISRFHPTYRLTDRSATPTHTLIQARNIGRSAGLKYVYLGNVPGDESESTFCYQCGKKVIERWGYQVQKTHLDNGSCSYCGTLIHGIGLS